MNEGRDLMLKAVRDFFKEFGRETESRIPLKGHSAFSLKKSFCFYGSFFMFFFL